MSSFLQYSQADTGPDPQVSVIWMHGLGDHGSSFVPLVKEFDLSGMPSYPLYLSTRSGT